MEQSLTFPALSPTERLAEAMKYQADHRSNSPQSIGITTRLEQMLPRDTVETLAAEHGLNIEDIRTFANGDPRYVDLSVVVSMNA